MWLIFALLAPFCFAVVQVLDSYCVEDVFIKPWIGAVTGAFASLILFLPLPYILPFISWEHPSYIFTTGIILAGICIQIAQALYFEALRYAETGVVAAYWNMISIFLPLAAYIVIKENLPTIKYLGIFILVVCSIFLCLIDSKKNGSIQAFFLMIIAAFIQVVSILLMDVALEKVPYIAAFYLMSFGIIIAGLFPLLFQDVRQDFIIHNFFNKKWIQFFILLEMINLIGYASFEFALKTGLPSLVTSLEATMPAFTILISILLIRFSDLEIRRAIVSKIKLKILIMLLMIFSVWIIS